MAVAWPWGCSPSMGAQLHAMGAKTCRLITAVRGSRYEPIPARMSSKSFNLLRHLVPPGRIRWWDPACMGNHLFSKTMKLDKIGPRRNSGGHLISPTSHLCLVSILSQLHPTCASQPSRGPPQLITGMCLLVETHLQSIVHPSHPDRQGPSCSSTLRLHDGNQHRWLKTSSAAPKGVIKGRPQTLISAGRRRRQPRHNGRTDKCTHPAPELLPSW